MDKDSFTETLRKQFRDQIRAAYIECEHASEVDFGALRKRLRKLVSQSTAQGISAKEFADLVQSTLPEIRGKLDFSQITPLRSVSKKAA